MHGRSTVIYSCPAVLAHLLCGMKSLKGKIFLMTLRTFASCVISNDFQFLAGRVPWKEDVTGLLVPLAGPCGVEMV